ncbi:MULTISPECIES: helix-turn-helix domain-containing protein [unclassified Chryseobacterium]|uniref:helix-turn-helix domain-containing protein n=1 Tax=unclassified Chryseobacterium TaxID=2593645 RepID=UPI00300FAE57
MEKQGNPDYIKIYTDLIELKYPEKKWKCQTILSKDSLSPLDVINLEKILFKSIEKEFDHFNQAHRSYNEKVILEILEYQDKNSLNNSQVARHFKLSRNTLTRWKRIYKL